MTTVSPLSIPAALRPEDFRSLPLRTAVTLPAYTYANPEFHAFETRAIFSHTWQLIGRAAEVQIPGDYLVAEIAGKPVIAVRGNDGVLRGFFNVCKHRAGPLAVTNGNARFLQCRYHGWVYTLEGRLRATHEMQEAEGFDPSGVHLESVHLAEWQNLVFAAIGEPEATLRAVLDGITGRIAPVDLSTLRFHARVEYELHCNWKVYVDNYLEGYHLPYVHPRLNKLLDYRNYVTETTEWYSWQHSPVSGGAGLYAGGEAQYYFVFP
ncbi:MAG: aromatic ring-hydroxylating dioxygenase subunit alpha, partial [Gammaproteobacteria bacterium]|nr:aromatic ring-hydroxylating dioxygenase subunit alpha [Gammaproteobacteria bacterium]